MISVQDIMQTDVVSVSPDTSARELARMLADEEISGAPVIDAQGLLVGVVSQTDLVRLAADDLDVHLTASAMRAEPRSIDSDDDEVVDDDPYGFFLPEDTPFSSRRFLDYLPESDFDTVPVRELMTPVTFSVEPSTSVTELARFLVRGRIHRAVVVEANRLVGIVTSNDVLRAVGDGQLSG